MTELLKALIVNKTYTSLRTSFYGVKQSQNGWERFFAAFITMTLIFRYLLIMPQEFGVNFRN